MYAEALVPSGNDEVDERQYHEYCDKHVIVDDGWVAISSRRDDVANKGKYDDGEEELTTLATRIAHATAVEYLYPPKDEVDGLRHHVDSGDG